MTIRKLVSLLCLLAILIGSVAIPTHAAPPSFYKITSHPPRPPSGIHSPYKPLAEPSSAIALSPLKAVLLVGPIDGNNGEWTLSEVANMERAANVLEAQGVTVYRFYPGQGTFAEIEAAANGANFLLYRGHGVYDGNDQHPTVGGFYLSSGFYGSDRIRSNLHLARNSIVMLYGCFTAGTTSGDTGDIGVVEAGRRVSQYSDPFFDIGAAGYYADWFGDAFEVYLSNLFAGQTLGQAYENYFDFNPLTVYRTSNYEHPEVVLWLDKDNWGYWQYNNAFSGYPDKTLADLFSPPSLGGIPANFVFSVDVYDNISFQPSSYTVTPVNTNGDTPIQWSLTTVGDWFSVSAQSGTTPASFSITPTSIDTTIPGQYNGEITITAVSPAGTQNSTQTISLKLVVSVPQLGGLPAKIAFAFSIPEQRFLTDIFVLKPLNVGNSHPLHLTVSTTSTQLLDISPAEGNTLQDFVISIADFNKTKPGVSTGKITVTATTLASNHVYQSPQTIDVSLSVVDTPFYQSFLPVISLQPKK